jgi:hypothetical protein
VKFVSFRDSMLLSDKWVYMHGCINLVCKGLLTETSARHVLVSVVRLKTSNLWEPRTMISLHDAA